MSFQTCRLFIRNGFYFRQNLQSISTFALAGIVFLAGFPGSAQTSSKQQIRAPFWRLGGGWSTAIVVNNTQPRPIEVAPSRFSP